MITKAVLVFWVRIVVVGEYVATFERKQLSLLSGVCVCVCIYIYIYIYIYTHIYIYIKQFIRCHFPGAIYFLESLDF